MPFMEKEQDPQEKNSFFPYSNKDWVISVFLKMILSNCHKILYNLNTVNQITYCQDTVAKLQESQIPKLPK